MKLFWALPLDNFGKTHERYVVSSGNLLPALFWEGLSGVCRLFALTQATEFEAKS